MEKELISKYRILNSVEDLSILKKFLEISKSVILYNDFEIEPFVEFSLQFQADYWYLKYHLIKNGEFILKNNEHKSLYDEKSLNIIWVSVKNSSGTIIECKDGHWIITLKERDENGKAILESYNLLAIK